MVQEKLNNVTGEAKRCYSGNYAVVQEKLNDVIEETKRC